MSFSQVIIVAAFAVVSFPARSAVYQAPTAAAEIAIDRMSYTGAGAASCTHPLFPQKYPAGDAPFSVAIGDLDGVNGPDLAVANFHSDDVTVLLNLCTAQVCPGDLNADGVVNVLDLIELVMSFGPCEGCPADFDGDGDVDAADLAQLLGAWGICP